MVVRKFVWSFVFFVGVAGALMGCGRIETQIEHTTYLRNTDDNQGPYTIHAVILSDLQPLKATVVYTTDNWKTQDTVEMTRTDDTLFKGYIPGQTAGTTIRYYIQVEDSEGKQTTDPIIVPGPPGQVEDKDMTYRFQIQTAP